MRLIDADELTKDLIENKSFYPAIVKRAIENAPTEDVVLRAEVEELKKENEDLRNVLANTINKYRNCENEVAKQIFEEIAEIIKKIDRRNSLIGSDYGDLLITDIGCCIGELKKKYIGETK